jgi:hypothetical protein
LSSTPGKIRSFQRAVEKARAKVFGLAELLSQQALISLESLTISFDSLWVAPEKRRSRS